MKLLLGAPKRCECKFKFELSNSNGAMFGRDIQWMDAILHLRACPLNTNKQ